MKYKLHNDDMKKKIVIHPYLFAIFPIISFYDHNKDLAQLSSVFFPSIISLVFTIILFSMFKIFVKDRFKAAIISSTFITLFFLFGHFSFLISRFYITIGDLTITNYPFLIILWLDIIVLATIVIFKTKKNLTTFNGYLNTFAFFLILLPLINIGVYEYKSEQILENFKTENYNFTSDDNKKLPDIYFIVFDGYARADILKNIYGYDNIDFIDYLSNKGFYVAHQSRANYPQTHLSIASTLNFKYLNYISEFMGKESFDRKPLDKMIKDNRVYQVLKNKGYLFVSFPDTSWNGKTIYADIKLYQPKKELNDFENALLNMTPLSRVWTKYFYLNSYSKKILFNFSHLPDITKLDVPTFFYAHFLIPHPPFVFNKDGKSINSNDTVEGRDGSHYFEKHPSRQEYRERYKNQLVFANKKIQEMIDEVLIRSNKPPIIILQSDHGPGSMTDWEDPKKTNMKERLSILNAYYLPEEGKKLLYQSITPVNTFRVVFNYLFNTQFDILDDKSYFATWSKPYKFIDVTDRMGIN